MKAPPRLMLDPEIARELRADLQRVAEDDPRYDVAAGLAAFEVAAGLTTLAQSAGAAHAASTAQASAPAVAAGAKLTSGAALKTAASMSALKVGGLAATVIAVATAATLHVHAPKAEHAATPASPRAPHSAPAAPSARSEPSEPARNAPQLEVLARDSPPSEAARAPHASARAPREVSPLRRETLQLGRVRDALNAGRALEAYELAEDGHREFEAGMHWQEREGLATLALYALGRNAQADRRARALLERYPNCAVRAELEEHLRAREEP